MGSTQARKQPKYAEEYDVGDDDHLYSTPNPSSARKYRQPIEHDTLDDPLLQRGAISRRRSHALTTANGASSRAIARPPTEERLVHRRFPLVAILLGMVVMALLAVALSSLTSWWRIHQDAVRSPSYLPARCSGWPQRQRGHPNPFYLYQPQPPHRHNRTTWG